MDAARFSQGLGSPFEKPLTKVTARRIDAAWGAVFFGYFLLGKQKKVPRLSGRDPTSKTIRRDSDTTHQAYKPLKSSTPETPIGLFRTTNLKNHRRYHGAAIPSKIPFTNSGINSSFRYP